MVGNRFPAVSFSRDGPTTFPRRHTDLCSALSSVFPVTRSALSPSDSDPIVPIAAWGAIKAFVSEASLKSKGPVREVVYPKPPFFSFMLDHEFS